MRKEIILIFLLILILFSLFFIMNNGVNQQKQVTVGGIYLDLPEGYDVGNPNKLGHINITNGKNTIFLANYNDGNISKYVNQYKSEIAKNNQSVSSVNLTINNMSVYESINLKTDAHHYWFVENGTVYTIYNWDKNSNIEKIVYNMIESIK